MTILAECPTCRRKQKIRNKACKCGANLVNAKRAGRVRYWVKYYLPGKIQRTESAGFSLDEAKDKEAEKRGLKRNGKLSVAIADKVTFEQLTEWYLAQEMVKRLKSFDIVKIKLEKFNRTFGKVQVNRIKPIDLRNYQARLLKQGFAQGTVDHDIGKVKTMINLAFENDMIGPGPYKAFKKTKKTLVKGSDVRDRVLSRKEFARLLTHAKGHTKGIIAMAYYTGMRKGEILGLTWDQVNLKARMIYLEAADTKDDEPRKVPITSELYDLLKEIPSRLAVSDSDRHVFQFQEKPVQDIRDGLKSACKGANIKYGRFVRGGFIFHDLRHTFTTNARRAGVPEQEIMAITGHSSRSTFDRYNTVDEDDIRRASDRIGDYLASSYQSSYQADGNKDKQIPKQP